MSLFRTGGLLLVVLGSLSGCISTKTPSVLPQNQARNEIRSESYRISFIERADGQFQSEDGTALPQFLSELEKDPPGYVRLTPKVSVFKERDLIKLLEQSGLPHVSVVDLLPSAPGPTQASVDIEITYYYYDLADCGADLEYRKLDHIAMTSPGFGCAVERNRLLSLARPGDWRNGGRLPPPLATSEVKAVTTYESLAPRLFPPAGN